MVDVAASKSKGDQMVSIPKAKVRACGPPCAFDLTPRLSLLPPVDSNRTEGLTFLSDGKVHLRSP